MKTLIRQYVALSACCVFFVFQLRAQQVTSFTLVDANTNSDVRTIIEGDIVNLNNFTDGQISIRANTNPSPTGSVVFQLNGSNFRTENVAPYTLAGDNSGDYFPWQPALGNYTLTATPYGQSGGSGSPGSPLTINFTIVDELEVTVPTAPSSLEGAVAVAGTVELTWTDNSDNEISFELQASPDGSNNWIEIATINQNSTAYTDNSLDQLDYRSYRIRAINSAGASTWSNTLEVTNLPYPPTDFVITNVTETSFDLAWTEAPYGNDYLIEFATSSEGPFSFFDALYYGYTAFSYSGLVPGTDYWFRMRTNFDGQPSAWNFFTVSTIDTTSTGPAVTSLVLINADTDADISAISEGDIFYLDEIGTNQLNIRAEVTDDTESVIFGYQDNPNFQTENFAVYAIGGNSGNDYKPWIPELGANTVTATAYTGNNGGGTAGPAYTLNFEVLSERPDTTLPAVVRINAGGETISYGDTAFLADDYFSGNGKPYANNNITDIANTTQDGIYLTERSTNANLQSFQYSIPLTNGDYTVVLHFAEIYFGATGGGSGGTGKRIFSVSAEGTEVLTDYDINAEVGPMTAVLKSYEVNVQDEILNLEFSASVNQPKLSAIEIYGEGSLITGPETCSWTELATSSESKVEAQSAKVNGKLYVLAGFLSGLQITGTTEIYDPATDTWTLGAPMPTPVTHMGAATIGDEIWIVAGFVGNHPGVATDKVQIYNTVTDSWSEGPALPAPRGSGAAVYSNGKLHFFGGLQPDRVTDVGEHYILDIADIASGWQPAADMPNPRNHLSGAAIDGKIYAIGGQYGHDNGVQDQAFLHEYDPATDSWTRLADLPTPRSHFEPGTIVHNDKILIVGGRQGGTFYEDISEYDPSLDSWSERCPLPEKLLAPAAKVFGDQLIVANGGENGTCCPLNKTRWLPIEPEVSDDIIITGELKKWHKVTISFPGPETDELNSINPFRDYRLNVTFTNGSTSYTVPGYYAADGNAAETSASSGNVWRVHFSPDLTGNWTYTASFKQGSDIALDNDITGASVAFNGATGNFNIAPSDKSGRDFRAKGRLHYKGEHYLQFTETGEAFFKAGADAPENTLAYEDFDATPNQGSRRKSWAPHLVDYNASEASVFTWNGGQDGTELLGMVNYLSTEGMNVFSFLTFSLDGDDDNVYPHLQEVNGANSWNDVYHDRFDVSKLAQWERIFEYADQKGMYLHFKTQETENDQRMDGGQLGPERKLYYRELIARFGHHLALNWNLGEENDIWSELSDPDNDIVKSYADYIHELDPYKHNIVIHTYPGDQDEVYDPLLGNASELTGASVQTNVNNVHNDVRRWVANSAASGKKWVVANDEQGGANKGVSVDADYPDADLPENRNESDNRDEVRHKVLWGTMLAGGAGVEYYYGYQTGCDDLDCQDHRTRASKWRDARIAIDFFNDHLQPYVLNMVSNDGLTSSTSDYVFTGPDVTAIYLPSGGTTNINLGTDNSNYSVNWYNPRSGGALQSGSVASITGNGSVSIGNPPNEASQDWVVLLKKTSSAPLNVLVYHETNGFRHNSIDAGISAIEELGSINNWETSNSQNSDVFNTANLENVDVVVWLNTSGNGLLTSEEQDAFESYIQNGGGFVGVHAATDTYRDGSWPWYNDLVGAIVQTGPNHTANNFNATMDVINPHPAVDHLGTTWNKDEEYYYWELNGGYLYSGNTELLRVRSTGSNSYDAARPITWYKNYDGGRSFYTALGHNSSDYNTDNNFRTMLAEAILWAADATGNASRLADMSNTTNDITIYPNPASTSLSIKIENFNDKAELSLISLEGNAVISKEVQVSEVLLDISGVAKGTYILRISDGNVINQKLVVIY